MDKNMEWLMATKVKRTMENLEKNNISSYFINTREELIEIIETLSLEGDKVAVGGSATLNELDLLSYLRSGRYNFLDRYKEGLTREEVVNIFRESLLSDVYITSTNAITEEGYLYNVDGNGNRVAAMLYGPNKVIVICGVNKLVKNVDEAIERNKSISAPANAKRLDRKTPCSKIGYCMDCKSEERICKKYTLIKEEGTKGRMHVIILNENLGY
ncbi:lactate utilization protein [Clostridium massiliamazoniense]|uniref:lactate utilization protein n=1 Tax=Clostridium massiliamazoniense TaxID=1347366 RepID=UPI0006D8310B|nr:lactate utilization protein [Clostridium massiliamazoniense]